MGLIILPNDEKIKAEREAREADLKARAPRLTWVYGTSTSVSYAQYHAYMNPKSGVEEVSFCGEATTKSGGETKTPGAPHCKKCVIAIMR